VFQLRPWRWRFGVRIGRSTTYAPSSRTHSGNVHILLTYVFHRRTYFPCRASSTDARIFLAYLTRRRYTDVRDSLTYIFYRRTSSTLVRILLACVFYRRTHIDDARTRSTTYVYCDYVFLCRTHLPRVRIPMTYVSSGDVRIHVRVLPMYVFYRRTCAIDVRVLPNVRDSVMYVFGTTLSEIESRDYASRDGFGTTQSRIEESGLRGTFWI